MKNNKLEEFVELERQVDLGGEEKAIEKPHGAGKLSADERIRALFEKDTFVDLDMLTQHQDYDLGMEKRRPYRDAVITGSGLVNGRKVY